MSFYRLLIRLYDYLSVQLYYSIYSVRLALLDNILLEHNAVTAVVINDTHPNSLVLATTSLSRLKTDYNHT